MTQDKHYFNESDIGSGEKTQGQKDVERDELSLGTTVATNLTPGSSANANTDREAQSGRMLQSGDHLARINVIQLPDETFEAQVYVRLTREPPIAETYIPSGTYGTEAEAWKAAEERAQRAFNEHEF